MVRVKDKSDLYVHQAEGDQGGSLKNWNVIGTTDLGRKLVERYVYSPYGELTVDQKTGFGDRDGDGDVDSTDKGTVGVTCTGTVTGACRILDLDFDGDYDSTDATKFDALPQGLQRTPGRMATAVQQPFAHQGLLFEPEIGSYQNRARQYEPTKRRFVQRDSFGYVDGLNPYYYIRNNPLRNLDPLGHCAIELVCWQAFSGFVGNNHHCELKITESAGGTGSCRGTGSTCPSDYANRNCCFLRQCASAVFSPAFTQPGPSDFTQAYFFGPESACGCVRNQCSMPPSCYGGMSNNSNTMAKCMNQKCGLGFLNPSTPSAPVPGWDDPCPQ
jgi:RHS repeat-associated protein